MPAQIPALGTRQADARLDGAPQITTSSLWTLRASDGLCAPLNDNLSVAIRGRSSAATIYASDGTSGSLAAIEPAFSAEDWDNDGVREEQLLLLSSQEALRFYDAASGRLTLAVAAMTLRLDFIERGNATTGDAPYWSFTTDGMLGNRLEVVGSGTGNIIVRHADATNTRESAVAVSFDDRCSLRALFYADGSVQAAIVRNNGGEVIDTRSAALAVTAYGAGGLPMIRLNERGNSSRGTMAFRYGALYGGTLSRRQMLERR